MSGVQELHLSKSNQRLSRNNWKHEVILSWSCVRHEKKRYYTATQFSLYFTTFSGCSISTPRYYTLRAVEKTPTGFKVLRLPRKNVLHAPGCDKMAILDHGEVLPQTLLHARRCGKTQILQDFELPHSKNFINV